MTRRFPLVAAFAAFASLAAAATAMAASAPVVIEFNDGVITPQRVELAAGQAITLVLRNTGATAAEFESKRLKQERVVAPGAELEVSLPALPAGDYAFVEEFHETQPSAQGVVAVK